MADYDYVSDTGVILTDTADLLTAVQDEYRAALGGDLVLDPSTPQGVLITAETLARDAVMRNNAALANQINPNLAGGVFLDAICALTGLNRLPATRSVVQGVVLAGVPGTAIPEGVVALTEDGDRFESLSAAAIGVGGTVDVDFRSVEYGPIACAVGTLTRIESAVLGWETVTNPAAATLGTVRQGDQDLRAKRRNTMALQGVALPVAITSALYAVEEVGSLVFRENISSDYQIIDGVEMRPHSIYVCVRGGRDSDVAQVLLANKSLGAGFTSGAGVAVTMAVVESASGQSYQVSFDRPQEIPVKLRVTVKANTTLIDPQAAVRGAIMAYVRGELDGEAGFVVGADVSPFELAGAVSVRYPGLFVRQAEATTLADDAYGTATIPIAVWQVATLSESNIQVVLA